MPEAPKHLRVGQLTELTHLDVHGCSEMQELPGMGQLTNLTQLDVHGCREILPGVEHLTSLTRLDVGK